MTIFCYSHYTVMRTILFRLIHSIISLGEFLYHLIVWLPTRTLAWKKSPLTIQADSKYLKKLPAHVGFVVVEKEFSLKDLANLIVWSVSLGISYITVYDINGEIKRNSLLLEQNVNNSKEEILGYDKSSYDIQIISSHPAPISNLGPSKTHQARVHLLCAEDGHKRIVEMAYHFSQKVCSGMYRVEDIRPSNVETVFQESMQFPDPDLCLKFGTVDSLYGYLPWQIRLTEIMFIEKEILVKYMFRDEQGNRDEPKDESIPSHKGITYKSFLSSLIQYGNTDQRFGK